MRVHTYTQHYCILRSICVFMFLCRCLYVVLEISHASPLPPLFHLQNPEYSKGYYATGGLVPGSSITLRASGKPTLRKSDEVGGGDANGKTMRTYKEIARERELQYDLDQVCTAAPWFMRAVVALWRSTDQPLPISSVLTPMPLPNPTPRSVFP
jgi:hypothetical protein